MMRPALFVELFSTEVRRRMSYRMDFWFNVILNFVIAVVVPWFFWGAVFAQSETPVIKGFTLDDMLLYVCAAVLIGRLVRGGDFSADVANDIYEGTLNRFLLYPAGYLGMKYTTHLGSLLPNLLQVFLFLPLLVFVLDAGSGISMASLCMALPLILLANLLYYLLTFPLQAVAFWADNVWSLVVMMHMTANLLGGVMIPLALFPDGVTQVLRYLPFAYLYDFPIRCLLGQVGLREWVIAMAVSVLWCGILYGVGRVVWSRGERSYAGVGI